MTVEDHVKAGNSFLWKAFIAFILIHYLVLPKLPATKHDFNQAVSLDIRRLQAESLSIRTKLRNDEEDRRRFEMNVEQSDEDFQYADRSAKNVQNARNRYENERRDYERLEKQHHDAQERLTTVNQQWVNLNRAKVERELKIPGTDITVEEADVKKFYPVGLALVVFTIWWYRRGVLAAAMGDNTTELPFWSAPVAMNIFGLTLWRWAWLNLAGLSLLGICISLFFSFAKRDEFYTDHAVLALSLAMGLSVLVMYGYELGRMIRKSVSG